MRVSLKGVGKCVRLCICTQDLHGILYFKVVLAVGVVSN